MFSKRLFHQNNIILWILFVVLPLTYIFPFAKCILLISIVMLALFVLINGSAFWQLFKLKMGKKNIGTINILFYCSIIWFIVIGLLVNPKVECFVRIVQIVGCFIAFNLGANQYWSNKNIVIVQKCVCVILASAMVMWAFEGFPISNYGFIFENPNTFSNILLCWLIFSLIGVTNRKKFTFISIIGGMLLYVSSARAAILGFVFFIVVLLLLRFDYKENGVFNRKVVKKWEIIFLLFLVLMVSFVLVYSKLPTTDIGRELQIASIKYTGKNFFSGRHKLWGSIIDLVSLKPICGYGLAALPVDFIDMDKSSHNTFLQIAMQTGVPGLLFVLLLIKKIYTCCLLHSHSDFALFSIAVTYAMIVHENFEVTLTQNLLVAGLEVWFMLGMGCINRGVDNNEESVLRLYDEYNN